jgi:hypothetical protein
MHSQASRKRSRRNVRKKPTSFQDDDTDYHSNSERRCGGPESFPRPTRGSKKPNNIVDGLVNLADYNAPPVTRSRKDSGSQDTKDERPRTSRNGANRLRATRFTTQSTSLSEKLRIQSARITKFNSTAVRRKKSSFEEKVRAEAEKLVLWPGWVSEEEGVDECGDEDQDVPRSHSRLYPSKTPGTQNRPWKELPGEVRNSIYQYAMADEEQKILNIRHYPDGVPRRSIRGIASSNNFAHSYWGLTQTCHQIREEFTPWLLEKRRVRTAIETISDYVDTFHRPDKDGRRVGCVEPICCGAPLPHRGVDVLELLKLQKDNPRFHLQLIPTTVSEILDALSTPRELDDFDELKIIHDMAESFHSWSNHTIIRSAGLDGIHITSVAKEMKSIADTREDEDDTHHEILIKFIINPSKANKMPDKKLLERLNAVIFASQLSNKTGVKLETHLDTGVAIWKVRRIGVIDMRWKAKDGSVKFFRRLTQDFGYPGFTEESLD